MSQPPAYNRVGDLTDYAAAHPSAPFDSATADAEFDALETTVDAILTNLALLQNDSGGLVNGLVTPNSLSTATKTLIAATWVPRGLWVTGSAYTVGDVVDDTAAGITTSYVCAVAHTAGTLATDVAAGKWNTLGATVTGAASSVSFSATGTIAATNVQTAIAEVALEALQVSSNLSDVGSVATARSNLSVPSKAELQQQTVFVAAAGGTANAITASYTPAPTTLVDKMRFVFVASTANTTTTPTFTPNSGTLTAKTIVKGANTALVAGDIPGQYAVCIVQYNSTLDKWVLVNPAAVSGSLGTTGGTMTGDITMSGASVIEAEGADVASASSCNIWATDGNTVHITGTVTIADFATAPQAGAWMKLIFDDAVTLTQSGNLNLNAGGSSVTTAAGDIALVYADTTTAHRVYVFRKSGQPVSQPALRSYLAGLTMSTAGSSATMSIAAGTCTDSTNVESMALASIAKTTSSWAVGTGNGGLDTGAIANSTWYHFFVIKRTDTGVTDVLISLSATAPTMPANYSYKRRIGSGKTDGSAQWVAFTQTGDEFLWTTPVADVSVSNTLTTSRLTSTLASVPTGVVVDAKIRPNALDASSSFEVVIQPIFETDAAPAETATPGFTMFATTGVRVTAELYVKTNTSAQIASRSNLATVDSYSIITLGWIDRRGRDS